MRKLCPNIDKEDGLETVLEIPIPEEMYASMGSNAELRWQNMLAWMRAQTSSKRSQPIIAARINELRFLLYMQASTAKYIVQQYIAATGGQAALNAVHSMCVTGEVKISASKFHEGDQTINGKSSEETGGFVLWQKDPDLWMLELLVSGCKVICGSNGKISWRHSSNHQTPISKGPPRPLRRFLQRGPNYEIIHHTMWGYFSQRSGLLIQFEDSRLIGLRTDHGEDIFWETSTESIMDDYRHVDGVNIAHSGQTLVTVFRYGEQSANHKREMEEKWKDR
ncbi:hypothetical protein OIU84_006014 [Salix udensis]|uniref:Uncharacterized protein n=1 Tax=Salix udensis TaxID=889485 RepID=A0AAD6JXE3_9ROSI|nr:hypothetical protein OIU84_006014 [Salix udensis]